MRHTLNRCGFIILFGTRSITANEGGAPIEALCPHCRTTTRFVGTSVRNWFTVFFIPIFPISGAQRGSQCTQCRTVFNLPIDQLRGAAANSGQRQFQEAIMVYNRLRENPTDSVLLFQVMNAYASMGEFDQAISAARDFPAALANSSQCRELLARIEAEPKSAHPA